VETVVKKDEEMDEEMDVKKDVDADVKLYYGSTDDSKIKIIKVKVICMNISLSYSCTQIFHISILPAIHYPSSRTYVTHFLEYILIHTVTRSSRTEQNRTEQNSPVPSFSSRRKRPRRSPR